MRLQRLITHANRPELIRAVEGAELYSRLTLQGPKRTLPQNRLMWSLLSDFADQLVHNGRKYDELTWKCIGMHALGKEVDWVPGFEGEIVALGYRSSELDIAEMSNLIELLYSEGAQRGVVFHGEAA
jgi:NinB protein